MAAEGGRDRFHLTTASNTRSRRAIIARGCARRSILIRHLELEAKRVWVDRVDGIEAEARHRGLLTPDATADNER